MFAGERESLDEAYPGDVVGVVNPGLFVIGDTVATGEPVEFPPIPSFPPENFGLLRNRDVTKDKQFRKGILQLQEEGVVQLLFTPQGGSREPILAAVGKLQFEVVESRLLHEYGVTASVQPLSFTCACWLDVTAADDRPISWPFSGFLRAFDSQERRVCLFESPRVLDHFLETNAGLEARMSA